MDINRDYHAHSGNYTPGGNSCRYIVIHNTGNTANASGEAHYAKTNQHPSSYHYVLDGSECYQILDDADTAWAVGAWVGNTQVIGNRESISIEVCSNGTEFTQSERDMLRELVGILMARHGIDADHVVRHYDCHYGPRGRKSCPAYYSENEGAWEELRDYITNGQEDEVTSEDIEKIAQRVSDYMLDGRMQNGACIIEPKGRGRLVYFDGGSKLVNLTHEDQPKALDKVHQAAYGGPVPRMEMEVAWFSRLLQACGYQSADEIPDASVTAGI